MYQTAAEQLPGVPPPAPPTLPFSVPQTAQEVAALRAQRSELSNQLSSAVNRRNELVADLSQATSDVAKTGLEQRILVLDNRIVRIEQDIATTGELLARSPALARQSRSSEPWLPPASRAIPTFGGIATLLLLVPFSIMLTKRALRRGGRAAEAPTYDDSRLERIEQAVDAIAIEVERISEAQRFTSKMLGDGGAVPVRAQERSPEYLSRRD